MSELKNRRYEVTNDVKMDAVKEDYCPQCLFEDDKTNLREDCPGHKKEELNDSWIPNDT